MGMKGKKYTYIHTYQGRVLHRPMRVMCHKPSVINSTLAPDTQRRHKEEGKDLLALRAEDPREKSGLETDLGKSQSFIYSCLQQIARARHCAGWARTA